MERKTFEIELKDVDEDRGEVTAYLAVFGNIDHQGDRIRQGAFANSIKQYPTVPMISQHLYPGGAGNLPANQVVLGKWRLSEDEHGLLGKGRVNLKTQAGREHFELLKSGDLNKFSIGYETKDADFENVEGKSIRNLKEIVMREGSLVIFPANDEAELVGVKADFSAEDRRRLAAEGVAMPDGSFPIRNRTDLENAIHDIGRANDPDAARAHIRKRAHALGAEDLLPDDWKALDEDLDHALAVVEDFLVKANLEGFETKAGARNSAADLSRIQLMHDMAQQMHEHADALGATCDVPTDNDGPNYDAGYGDGKGFALPMTVESFVDLVTKTVIERV